MQGILGGVRAVTGSAVGFFYRQIIQLLKRVGVLKLGRYTFSEDMSSPEEYNVRVDLKSKKRVPFKFHVEACADLVKFLDPSSDGFLTWEFGEGSYVDLPGIAEGVPTEGGRIKLVFYRTLIYDFRFRGKGKKLYRYYGSKNLLQPNQIIAWTTLKGEVTEAKSGKKVLDSTTFFAEGSSAERIKVIIPFLLGMRIR